ncbi:MAG TPA: CNNM domain-containing protein [Chthoniobacteraceae bacterium]|jgi:CBS domain containing-hemolysin-like protein|nr:CNNM domain-containing protein [Chthoniobacteraceae bacterium]
MIWLAVGGCLLVSFVFSGIEAGILSVNRVRLKHRLKMGDSAARTLDRLLARRGRILVTVLLVTNLMNIFAITLATGGLTQHVGPRGYIITGLIALPIYLFGVELLPKALFRRFPYRALAALAGPLRLADLILTPLHLIGGLFSRLFFGRRPAEHAKLFVAREDFKYLTIKIEREGTLSPTERQMIHNVVDFRAITAREVMLPIDKVQTVRPSASLEELLARAAELRIDRWPVRTEAGEITGLVNVFDVALGERRSGQVESFQRRIVKVTAREPAHSVLRKLRAARTTLAAVVETGGSAAGIVTWEALVQRLVNTAVP